MGTGFVGVLRDSFPPAILPFSGLTFFTLTRLLVFRAAGFFPPAFFAGDFFATVSRGRPSPSVFDVLAAAGRGFASAARRSARRP